MPLWVDTVCTSHGHEGAFVSGSLALQLDNGTLASLRHPGERHDCERHGLSLFQASQRKRLFERTYYLCRRCGTLTFTVTRVDWKSPGLNEPGQWFSVKLVAILAAIAIPTAWWFHHWPTVAFAIVMVLVSPLIDLNEERKVRRERVRQGRPLLPTNDAPGRIEIPPPQSSPRCCETPDLVGAASVTNEDRVPCRECGDGVLRITSHGIS